MVIYEFFLPYFLTIAGIIMFFVIMLIGGMLFEYGRGVGSYFFLNGAARRRINDGAKKWVKEIVLDNLDKVKIKEEERGE